jgi:hypothetical protein
VISCIHLEEQTKDILKLKLVSNTTIRDVAKHLTFGGGGDVGGLYVGTLILSFGRKGGV